MPSALLLKAAALAARDVPEVNGFYDDGGFRPSAAVHLGVAVALRQGGLVAPAIHDADTLPVDVLMERLRDLVGRARAGRLQRAEMADPTITVTNLGDLGVESVFGVIYPPQVAMVGFGRVMEQPWAQNGLLGVRPAVTATLSADHRVSDGLRGGRFLDPDRRTAAEAGGTVNRRNERTGRPGGRAVGHRQGGARRRPAEVDADARLRQDLELDSLDFLAASKRSPGARRRHPGAATTARWPR